MTPEQAWDVIRVTLFLVYVFGFIPLMGAALGGNYSSYGFSNRYENCMIRGLIAHAVVGLIYLICLAIINL